MQQLQNDSDQHFDLQEEILRYVSFWPYMLILLLLSIAISFSYLRYTTYTYKLTSIIEIIDESQNNEMALPTELTVFNRSMINLENEINRLYSHSLNLQVVKELKSNLFFYRVGRIKKSQTTADLWFDNYQLDFKIETDDLESHLNYIIAIDDNQLSISSYDEFENLISLDKFNSLSTKDKTHSLPFDLTINSDKNLSVIRELKLVPPDIQADNFIKALDLTALSLLPTLSVDIAFFNNLNDDLLRI